MQTKVEPVVREFTTGEYYPEVYQAKQEFFERAGVVHDDDAEFEQRMNLFMDWYLFDRDLPGVDLPPIRYYVRQHQADFTPEDKQIFEDLSKLKRAFSRGDIFEGRIFPHDGKWHFAQGFCFHPIEMKSFIVNEIKKIRFQDRSRHLKLILQLAQMKLKHQRFSHIDVKHIYGFNSKF